MANPSSSIRFLPDSSCIIPTLWVGHQHAERAIREVRGRLTRGETMLLAGHALLETYSTLTRLPTGFRLSPNSVLDLLRSDYLSRAAEVVGLDGPAYAELIQELVRSGVAGGQVYDALIVRCAVSARADVLLTFNAAHFRQLAPAGLEVVVPE